MYNNRVLSYKYYSAIYIKSDNTLHRAIYKRDHKSTHATWTYIVQCSRTTIKPEKKTIEYKKLLILQLINKECFSAQIYIRVYKLEERM